MRRGIIIVSVAIPLAVLAWWISGHTYWAETKIPVPLKGEALRNPFYAAQRFADALGAHTQWNHGLELPSPSAVIVLSDWHWTLSASRRKSLEGWVESGGRVVLQGMLVGGQKEFEQWSGIGHGHRETAETDESDLPATKTESGDPCGSFDEGPSSAGLPTTHMDQRRYWLCNFDPRSFLRTSKDPEWTLRDASGIQVVRVSVGSGRVTVVNAAPFRYLNLFDGDHGALFVAATELGRTHEVHFLSQEDYPSLIALTWRYGRPVLLLTLSFVALALWRRCVRFGPLAPEPQPARRSLAEQIRGTGQFAWRHGGAESLHAACVRALNEMAQRRIAGYARLSGADRAAALARLTGFDWQAIAKAVHHPDSRRSQELCGTIALLEAVRRRIVNKHTRASHGTN